MNPPALLPWLLEAAGGIDIETTFEDAEPHYGVLVHNGLDGEYRTGAVVATCATDAEAELVAAGLRTLLEHARSEQP